MEKPRPTLLPLWFLLATAGLLACPACQSPAGDPSEGGVFWSGLATVEQGQGAAAGFNYSRPKTNSKTPPPRKRWEQEAVPDPKELRKPLP